MSSSVKPNLSGHFVKSDKAVQFAPRVTRSTQLTSSTSPTRSAPGPVDRLVRTLEPWLGREHGP